MIRLHLFGVPDLRTASGDKVFTVLAQPKQVALLAILAAARQGTVRREKLLHLLWPELDDARARNSLSKAIHHCRRAVGDSAISGRFAEEIALGDGQWVYDLWDFDAAIASGDHNAALHLALSGQFLDGLQVSDSVAMEHWIDGEQARVRRLGVESACALAERADAANEGEQAAEYLRVALSLGAFDERILRRRIALLDRMGDRAGALNAFAAFSLQLQRELEAEVSPETLALVDSIRRRALQPAAATDAATVPPVPSTHGVPVATSPGRDMHPDIVPLRTEVPGHGEPLSASAAAPPPPMAEMVVASPHRPTARHRWIRIGVAAMLLCGIALGGFTYAHRLRPTTTGDAGRIIVVPFVNQTNDTTLTPLGELAADLLAASLSRAGVPDVADGRTRMRTGLTVVSQANASDVEALADRARRAGFATIITGRYYLNGGILTVIAQIRSASESAPVVRFAEEQGPVSDPVPVLRRVEQRLLGAFASMHDVRFAAASTSAAAAPTYGAYVEYVAGMKPWIDGDAQAAASHFERAFRLDTNFVSVVPLLYEALLSSGRSESADALLSSVAPRINSLAPYDHAQLTYITSFHRGEREAMYVAARQMVHVAPHSPDAQWSRGFAAATTNRFEEATTAFAAADVDRWWTHDKLFASIHWQSISYHLLGRYQDELTLARAVAAQHPFEADACMYVLRAMAPVSTVEEMEGAIAGCIAASGGTDASWRANARLMMASELRAHDRPNEALRFGGTAEKNFRMELERDSTAQPLREGLASTLMELGRWAEALQLLEPMARARPDNRPPRLAANTAIAAAKLGRTALADEMLTRLRSSTPNPAFHIQRARVLAHRGLATDAITELRAAMAKGLSAAELFHANFGLDPLRREPMYIALVQPRR